MSCPSSLSGSSLPSFTHYLSRTCVVVWIRSETRIIGNFSGCIVVVQDTSSISLRPFQTFWNVKHSKEEGRHQESIQ